ncbi:MAG: four helix bundle protein [candidate division Zixibacteria bacterium CG_4_9_14_3_um_filter_46_8]|nr:MAG: four helix bundle protein [candidate division Zixibacteria bacterium CG_4_9_14_3_um_filter_46_8]
MRDHKKLRAFELADNLVLSVYGATKSFPREEQFGLTSQLRRAAISIASNIVEGCARNTEADFLHFLDMAYGSAREVEYQISLAHRLAYISDEDFKSLNSKCEETSKVLNGLIRSLRR